ncbi:MAG: DNA repair protein RecN [Bacteroidota bacterium]
MIKSLYIKNYAIIDKLTIQFSDGLTIITGETGAGKSILLGALGLIMGKRADTKVLYHTDQKCVIEATFEVGRYKLRGFFDEMELDYDSEVVIRREITPSGKSRAFVNDTPVNLKVLQRLSSALIDLHQQFDTLDIHNVSFQLRMIDALADNQALLSKYQTIYRSYAADKRQLQQLVDRNTSATKEMEFLQFQLQEFNEAELIEGEQQQLEVELHRLTNAEDIKRTTAGAFQQLSEAEQSIIGQLEEVGLALGQVNAVDAKLQQLVERYNGLVLELQDLSGELEQVAEDTEYDEERILEIQQRLDLIYRLQNKHNVPSLEELLAIQNDLEQQLAAFTDLGANIERLEERIRENEARLQALALDLRAKRKSVVPKFEKRIHKLLGRLSMEHARLQIEFAALEELGPTGLDEVNYLFAANKGGRLQLIKDVASGGEISRLTLVTKSLVASAIPLPTLIFDEIDTGISGDVALKMGQILRQLSDGHQVVSITHSPQVASKADRHYFVYKKIKEERTVTNIKVLDARERVEAIAVMLSQNPPSPSALENARELLGLAIN